MPGTPASRAAAATNCATSWTPLTPWARITPSETCRVLKDKEMRASGEYRTCRLVLEAWDKLESGELKAC